ncbi:MAG: hypothetical protein IJ106_06750 [Parasporobacterium sp.]|nr:hypothetical protein [Parasporobacterium sp.]
MKTIILLRIKESWQGSGKDFNKKEAISDFFQRSLRESNPQLALRSLPRTNKQRDIWYKESQGISSFFASQMSTGYKPVTADITAFNGLLLAAS